ncbi:MAG: LTA synthase family protein [Spirochaetes bacterium]|nr:LTA synthase family protein [Spirochaetota bacterium]
MKKKLVAIILVVNCLSALLAGVVVYGLVFLGGIARQSGQESGVHGSVNSGPAGAGIDFNRKTLMDREKTMRSLDNMKEKLFRLKTDDPLIYTRLPEGEFFKSLISYYLLSRMMSVKAVKLDEEMIRGYKEKGTLLYTLDENYPLMKKSIYVNPSRRAGNSPYIKPGTNIIIIFVESLSKFFLRDDVHGLTGLMPNIKAMERESFAFTDMYNSSFPTIKGLIAALGSTIYLLDENVGGTRIPIPCRFLFLSDIVKALNYTTIHIQSASERFISMKDFFMQRQSYDCFYGSESLAIDNIRNMSGGFGVDDETLFDYVVGWLEKYPGEKPLFLTISTINSHPPFKVKYTIPEAGGNDMLNALYSTDRAFGKFWSYFKKSKYRNNTLLILTADHAMGNNKEYISFVKQFEDHYHPYFDRIPCLLYFPGGALRGVTNNTPCVSLDLTPTLLDMMRLDLANPFMGLSIFSERPFYERQVVKPEEINKDMTPEKIESAKKLLGFYFSLYREDRIVPKDYTVRFH